MKKLQSFAFYALMTPVITLGAGSALAQPEAQDTVREQRDNGRDQANMQNQGYLEVVPANAMQASNLIGAEIRTAADENMGSVSDLIIDENGRILAVVIGVGGFLGMGERDIAVGWDEVTRSGPADDQIFRVDVTREDLRSAPEFENQD